MSKASRQNVLFILVDQWPAWAFGHRGADIATPNMDRLAAQGTVFTNAFTSCPLCSPARGALLTSRRPHQTGMYDNCGVGYSLQEGLSQDEATWIDEAVRLDYHTGYFGKWHLGPDGPILRGAHRHDPKVDPHAKPYDPATNDYSYERCQARYAEQGKTLLLKGRAPFWGQHKYTKEETSPFAIIENGVRFLEEHAAAGTEHPFFLTVSSGPPHFPHYLPQEYADLAESLKADLPESIDDSFEGKPRFHGRPWWPCMDTSMLDRNEWRTVIAYSHAHIMLVDEAIGRILGALDRLGLAESTTVVFTGDHGDMEGAHNRFDKGPYFYDEVWRIPLIVRAPGKEAATQDAFVSILDIGETFFTLIDAEPSADRPRAGRDLLPLVGAADPPADWPQIAFGIYDFYNGMNFALRAIRDDRFKYVWNPQDVDELYDLERDPHELHNLAGAPEVRDSQEALRLRLLDWLVEIGDSLPERVDNLPNAGTITATGRPGP